MNHDANDHDNDPYGSDGPSARDLDRLKDDTRSCPNCTSDIWDQADQCPVCGFPLDGSEPLPGEEGARTVMKFVIGMIVFGMLAGSGVLWFLFSAPPPGATP